jgi:hypothetical protein
MKLVSVLLFVGLALVFCHPQARAKAFYPTKPNCTTTCQIVNGQEICHTQCSGGNN